MREKRNHIRCPASEIEAKCLIGSKFYRNICRDISMGGLRIPETLPIRKEALIKLYFPPYYSRGFRIKGEVAWSKSKDSGVRFLKSAKNKLVIKQIESFIELCNKQEAYDFRLLLSFFALENKRNICDIFATLLKVLYFKKFALKKPRLKPKSILTSLDLVKHYLCEFKPVKAEGELRELMRSEKVDQGKAVDYYLEKVQGKVKDICGRTISLGEEVIASLFKNPKTGKKEVKAENFSVTRAKRLPWIRHTILNTKQIFEVYEKDWITYYYTMPFIVKYLDEVTKEEKTTTNHYLIVTKKKEGKEIEFVTAYVPDTRLDLFRKICKARVWNPSVEEQNSA